MKNLPAIVNLISGIIFSVLFLLAVLYSLFNFRRCYKNSILDGMLSLGYIIGFWPVFAFMAFEKSSDLHNRNDHLAIDDIAIVLFALLSAIWTVYAYFRLSKNVDE
jgi:hypothetical protein